MMMVEYLKERPRSIARVHAHSCSIQIISLDVGIDATTEIFNKFRFRHSDRSSEIYAILPPVILHMEMETKDLKV